MTNLDLNLLRVFVAVAESGSFTRAADQLHVTQSTVSQRIGRLEQQLDRKLLERTTRTTQLTEDGDALLRYAQQVDALSHEIQAEFSKETLTGQVHLTVPDDFVDSGFVDVLKRFKRLQPKVKVELRIGFAAEQHAWMDSGEMDLGVIRSANMALADDALWSERILWVSSRKLASELKRKNPGPIPLIHAPFPCLYREVALKALGDHGLRWNVVMTSPYLVGIHAAVSAGLGVAPVPECGVPDNCVVLGPEHGLPSLPDCHLVLKQKVSMEGNDAADALKELICEFRRKLYAHSHSKTAALTGTPTAAV